ncbi:MAG TPA: farnesyl diphosphate synthase [Pyrinomonadaceae bacterium]|nr:farnesyl diphosphate synthase [Pyrinomonadaceae bacterium]
MKTSSELSSTPAFDLEGFFNERRALIDGALDRLLPGESVEPVSVHQAIRWSVFAGGKRFRPTLLIATGEVFATRPEVLLATACALEMIHTYSLIHDDLPSMDDDELRRGRPTCHIRFDEATAILAGDALQTLAFQIIAEESLLSAEKRVLLVSELGRAAGTPAGMVAGQARDLEAESRAVTSGELEQIHRLKTAALIIAAARCGAIIADATDPELEAVGKYAAKLGLLFQITDDLLDITATAEILGKTPGKDARAQKATYPSLYGIEAAHKRAGWVHQEACAVLEEIDRPTEPLRAIADFILKREA